MLHEHSDISTTGHAFGACWGCVAKGCSSQLTACAADCACSTAIAGALSCVENGGALECFTSTSSPESDPALSSVDECLLLANIECSCENGVPLADAGCTQIGGGGNGGNGECSSNVGEMCNGINYQALCACPEGSCACFSGSSPTHVVSFTGCPYCPGAGSGVPGLTTSDDIFTLCGFPH